MKARTVNSITHYSCNSSWILVADTIWFSGFNETRVRVGLLLPQIRKKDNENWSDPILSEDIGLASKGHRYFFSPQMNLFYCCKDKVTLVRSIFPIDIQQGPIFAIEVQFSQRDRFLNKKKKMKKMFWFGVCKSWNLKMNKTLFKRNYLSSTFRRLFILFWGKRRKIEKSPRDARCCNLNNLGKKGAGMNPMIK